jgi:lipopolysaccharide export LptBFGC system permease protein LptF
MKLYATVTSERASKGQGGNKYLLNSINITSDTVPDYLVSVKNNEKDGQIVIRVSKRKLFTKEDYEVVYKDIIYTDYSGVEGTKGEKQKAECGHHYNYIGNTDTLCDKCTFCGEPR